MMIEIRPGVARPDWSAVTSPAAREALKERDADRGPRLVRRLDDDARSRLALDA